MLRRLFTILSAVSLLLCVAVAVAWVRGGRTPMACVVYPTPKIDRSGTARHEWRRWQLRRTVGVRPPIEAVVARVPGTGNVYINLGPADGAAVGSSFALYDKFTDQRKGSLEIVSVGPRRFSLCRTLTLLPGQTVREGDMLRSVEWVNLPYWPAIAVLSVLPMVWLLVTLRRSGRRAFRARFGRCLNCGYDVRATPGRCPECGTVRVLEVKA